MRIVREVNNPQITPPAGLYSTLGRDGELAVNVGFCVGCISTGDSVVVGVGDKVEVGIGIDVSSGTPSNVRWIS